MITAVLLDLYETLVTERVTGPVRASSLGARLGLDPIAFRKAWASLRPRVVRGQSSFADALIEAAKQLGQPVDLATVKGVCVERIREKASLFRQIDPNAVAVLRQLRNRGLKLAVVSNCFAEDVEAWPRCAVAPWVEVSVFSFDVGAAKPEPEIYMEALRRLDVESSHAVFIGDGGDDELLGAERVGLRAACAIWFRGELAGVPAHIPRLSSWQAVVELVTAGEHPVTADGGA
jgi:putative hydrolase of the HAD superfamily